MKKISAIILSAAILIISVSALAAPAQNTSQTPAPSPQATALPGVTAQPNSTALPNTTAQPDSTALPGISPSPQPSLTPAPTPSASAHELSKQFKLDIDITHHPYVIPNEAVIELYSDKNELLGTAKEYVGQDTTALNLVFDVPEYKMGQKFRVKLVSGLRSIKYYDAFVEAGGMLDVQTYGYLNDKGEYTQNNGCALTGNPHYEKELCMYVSGNFLKDISPRARIVDGVSMMPVRAIGEAMGLKVKYDKAYDSVVCSVGDDEVIFNANSTYTTIFGQDTFSPHATVYIEGSLFVPVRTLAEAFNSSLEVLDFGDHLDIIIGESPMVKEFRNRTPVNRDGIGSRTNYLVWVSKHEYKVRVYEGQQYQWSLLKEFPCALGAWDTPTITGQFEYIERTQWDYGTYYVGPVLRFHNGYALHSTLLYYGGGEYDGRVGVNISHGCVRLHPQDINWIADTIPFRTRIYITE